ncbi:Bug family tripartite tricarboxylate transporter substrate binding protein [Variovorax ginsengisoli]|uniref:Tripartite tricarboxylate transporter substrate binding protein n=1 Tax=Variovorax ginsengisoli TaxID=363844 RepID=A0ABT8SEL4_9BURK|nr:tripartite tricarboxylate transporter substrate binding protein [Variovorax ginsengisoli]MDN8618174.1 tripartite tricarboxylate transporter substrate binding protein [Variovorax ginsengisoli]MDO1537344.1 tripartite tricarboxylate transporter substrate binding protein [Variovorax ginsengisoli]
MTTHCLKTLALIAAASVLALASPIASAEGYPSRPVKIVVPYTAGGPVDQLARGLAERLGKSTGQPFIVENKPGGNTIVAASMVAKAPADGYTLFMASSASLAVNPLVYNKLAYDPDRDFAPVSLVASAPLVMVVGNATPATRLKDLIPYIRSREGSFAYASNGNGNPLHLACALFASMANVDMLHVPYNGTAPALASVLAGDTQMTCDIVLNSMPQIKAGKLRPIGIVGPRRVAALPDVPTLAEEGLLGVDAAVWFALVAPANTPAEVVARLNKEVVKAIDDVAMKARFSAMAMELGSSSPQDVVDLTNRERSKWAAVVRKHGIKVE